MKEVRILSVDAGEDGVRLDRWFKRRWPHLNHVQIQKLTRSGQIRVDGGRAKPDTRLTGGAQVRVPPLPEAPEPGERADRGLDAREAAYAKSLVLFEDDEVLVLNKPAGLAVQGGTKTHKHIDRLLSAWGEGLERPRLVHRLDRDTSGVLVVAKKRSALAELQALMREGGAGGGIRKCYLALLLGRMPDGTMSVDAPLHVGLRQGGERHVQVDPGGKPSLSHFKVLERRGGQSYCEVRIDTGRTHQIRVHAQHIGHPVAGDDKYGDVEANKRLRDKAGLRRLFLHAASLEFALDDGRTPYTISAPLAPELREVLDRL